MLHQINILSLSLAVAPLILAWVAVSHYFPRLKGKGFDDLSAEEWLMLGVTISFTAFGVNSLYWWVTFFAQAMEWDIQRWFFAQGQLANIFTRHIPYSAAALCHIMAFYKFPKQKKVRHPLWHLSVAAAASIAMWVILQLVAHK